MKKLIYIIGILALVLVSCQSGQNLSNAHDDQFFTRADAANQRERDRIAREEAVAQAEARLAQREAEAAARREQQLALQQAQTQQQQQFHYDDIPPSRTLTMDDYHDFMFSQRIRRFHSGFFMPSYFHNFHTNMFFFNGMPMYFGTSIHFGSSWWLPRARWGIYWRPTWMAPTWHMAWHTHHGMHAWGWGPSWAFAPSWGWGHHHHWGCWHCHPFHRPCDWAFYRWNYNFYDRNTVRFREFQPQPRAGNTGLPTNNSRPTRGDGTIASQNVSGGGGVGGGRPTRGGDFVTNYERAIMEQGGRPTRGGQQEVATFPQNTRQQPATGRPTGTRETSAQPQQRPTQQTQQGQAQPSRGSGTQQSTQQQRPTQQTQQGQTQQSTPRRYNPVSTPATRSGNEFSSPATRQSSQGTSTRQSTTTSTRQSSPPPSSSGGGSSVSRPSSPPPSSGSSSGGSRSGGSSGGGGRR